jgi:xanthine dehydrogenase YagS FAD-binding subunit
MRPFEYASPRTVEEVIGLLGEDGHDEDGGIRPLAGGTDLLTMMKADVAAPSRLVDIKRVSGLSGDVEETEQGLTLGALATLAEIETHPLIGERYPALSEAAALAATPQLRNMATIGGNLLQRPRCWYFRSPHFRCWLKGGDDCPARDGENQLHALFGANPCVAVHPSDLATALVALEAEVRLRGPDGERTLPIADFFALPTDERRTETVAASDELLLSVQLPAPPAGTRSTYLKAMDRKVWAFALVGVAAVMRTAGRRIDDARLVLGGVAPIPWRARAAEQALIGAEIGEELFARAADIALAEAQPLGHNAYKVPLARALVRRALASLTVDAGV